nr:MAG TPA: hypothetical protein [Bacteriophage sp.]
MFLHKSTKKPPSEKTGANARARKGSCFGV